MDMQGYLETLVVNSNLNLSEVVIVKSEKGEFQIPYRNLIHSLSLLKPKQQEIVMNSFTSVENDPKGIVELFKSFAQPLLKIKI